MPCVACQQCNVSVAISVYTYNLSASQPALLSAGALTLLKEKDTAYGLTLLWSLVAVYEKHKNLQAMKYVSLVGIVVLCVTASLSVLQRRRQTPYSPLGRSSVEEPLQG